MEAAGSATTPQRGPDPVPAMRPRRGTTVDVVSIVGGLAVVGVGMLAVRDGSVSGIEEWPFRAVNDLPGWLYPFVWPFQQLGALVLGPVVAVVALALRRYRLAIAALVVTLLKLVSERGVKALVSRQRPGTSIGQDIELRGDVHLTGESFVSGHAVLVAALAGVVTPYLAGRWKVVPWVLVGAVMFGRVYVGAHNPLDVICGAALGVAIAGAVNLATGARRARPVAVRRTERTRGRAAGSPGATSARVAVAVVGSLGLSACATSGDEAAGPSPLTDEAITVGSFDFAESVVLAEVYSQGLEAAGYTVERAFRLGPREFVGPALTNGLVELVPEYAGTAAEFHSLGAAEPTGDVAATHAELQQALAGRPVQVLAAAPGQDANTFVVTRSTAQRLGVETLSDLRGISDGLVFGGPPECPTRRLCLEGLADVYGLEVGEFVPLDTGGPLTHQALVDGKVDVALLFTTDPAIRELDLMELTDDRGLQPAENVTPLLRTEVVDRWGDEVVAAIDGVSTHLTTEAIRDLDRAASIPEADITAVVSEWWAEVLP